MKRAGSSFWLGNVVLARAGMSTKPKQPSHYEALEIDSRSTQTQIKTAYFELSKQYHPDKNSSDEAAEKFRNISEAYEVLGNYKTRRIYDRGLIVKGRGGKDRRHRDDGKPDTEMQYYQSQAAVFKDTKQYGSTPIYDFDAWTKAHYGQTLQRIRKDRMQANTKRQIREEFTMPRADTEGSMVLLGVSFFFLMSLFYLQVRTPTYDHPYETWELDTENSETENSNEQSHLPNNIAGSGASLSS